MKYRYLKANLSSDRAARLDTGDWALVLYSTVGCHLCEDAKRVVHAALGSTVPEVDIVDDDVLFDRYAVRIPVLRRQDTGCELGWPFGPEDVLALVRSSIGADGQ
jgi:hypothetical protein